MSENTGEINSGVKKISRRDFFKKATVAGGAVALGGALLNRVEKNAVENGISSGSGRFFPLYETHMKGLDAEKISNDLNIFFREGGTGGGGYSLNASMLGYKGISYLGRAATRWLPDPVLERLARNKIEAMTGDVDAELWRGSKLTSSILIGGVEFFAGIGAGLALLRNSFKNKNVSTRRRFLRMAGAAGAAWLMSPGLEFLWRGGPKIGTLNTEREDALDRIIDKAYGLSTKAHPEMLDQTFLRDLIMADKMLAVAEDFEERTGRKAKIGFNVEYAHNGIEDFLKVGHDVCRWIIDRYPKSVLKSIADRNGGQESLWTARLFKLPKDFSPGQDADWSQVTDRKVIDVELQKALAPKLS